MAPTRLLPVDNKATGCSGFELEYSFLCFSKSSGYECSVQMGVIVAFAQPSILTKFWMYTIYIVLTRLLHDALG